MYSGLATTSATTSFITTALRQYSRVQSEIELVLTSARDREYSAERALAFAHPSEVEATACDALDHATSRAEVAAIMHIVRKAAARPTACLPARVLHSILLCGLVRHLELAGSPAPERHHV